MTTGTSIKDRCRLCYTRLKDTSSLLHHTSPQQNRIYNIYKRRPFRYRDLIVRYLCIHLPENNPNDQYSNIICGTCATSLTELETVYRTYEQTQKNLRSKYRKTSHIVRYQLNQQMKISSIQKSNEPKRLSKRKGAPKHINQTWNNQSKTTSNAQLIFKIPSIHNDEESSILSSKQNNSRRENEILMEMTNQKKKFKRSTKDSESSSLTNETVKNDSYNCINLLQPSILTSTSSLNLPSVNLIIPGSICSSSSSPSSSSSVSINSRPFNSVKGNHIERIAASLLTGNDPLSENGTNDYTSDQNTTKIRVGRRKPTSSTSNTQASESTTATNNLLATTVATRLSPSFDEPDEDDLSVGDLSNDSSNISTNGYQANGMNVTHVTKDLSSSISATPTAEGLAITAINPTGQKQVFMAKQLGNLKKYQCGLCDKIVTNIQIHVRRHTNDKPYPCTYCEKRFTNSGDLQIHVRIHTGEKPYACPLCLKSYRTIGNFNSHVKTHDSGVRPHRCELCNQTFPIPKDWYSHLRSSHRSRIPNNNLSTNSNSALNSSNATTTVTQPLFSNALTSQQQQQQQHSDEVFVPNKMKLEPINRSQLVIKSSKVDHQKPVNMSKKENSDDEENEEEENGGCDDDDDDEEDNEENHHQSTRNLLTNVSSPVHA